MSAWNEGATLGARDHDARVDLAAENDLSISPAPGQYDPDSELAEMRMAPQFY